MLADLLPPSLCRFGLSLALGLWLGGCSMQPETQVLIREPGQRHYGQPPAPIVESARELWPYAVISSNVYGGSFKSFPDQLTESEAEGLDLGQSVKECLAKINSSPLRGWKRWTGFPEEDLRKKADKLGLYVEVWESTSSPSKTIAVVFKGTEFKSMSDWFANLRWFSLKRFVPSFEDQYTLLSKYLGKELVEKLVKDNPTLSGPDGKPIRLVSAGHSLGGGLAQHFAYSLPLTTNSGVAVPRISHVYAFDPSPVTGWYSVDKNLRADNAKELKIERVFEHGEILAYVRLILSYINAPSASNPAIRQTRFNFVRTANVIKSHSMPRLACELAIAGRIDPAAEIKVEVPAPTESTPSIGAASPDSTHASGATPPM